MEGKHDGKAEGRIRENVRYYGTMGADAISARIESLEKEWDLTRTLTTMAAGLGFFGLIAGLVGGKSWRIFTWMSLPMLFAHSLGRWVPPAEGLRRMGVRSCKDIEAEKYALKALRGDFKNIAEAQGPEADVLSSRASRALEAVKS
jgi:hypothetical protein